MKKLHYGWVICAACFIEMFLTAGLSANTNASYRPYLISIVGLSNTQASLLGTIGSLSGFLAVLAATPFYRKLNLRVGMMVSTVTCAAAYMVYSAADGFGLCVVAAVLLGAGAAMGGALSISLILSRWFHSRLGFAMGISTAGSGISSILASPIIEKCIHRYSLSATYFGQAVIMLVLTGFVFLLMRNDPTSAGTRPYQDRKTRDEAEKQDMLALETDKPAAAVAMVATFVLGGAAAAFGHYSVLYTSVGIDSANVATMLAIGGFTLTVGKLIFGTVVDSIGIIKSNYIFFGLTIAGFILACFARNATVTSMYLSYGILNLGLPLTTIGQSLWAKTLSSPEDYPKNLNRFQSAYLAGTMLHNVLPGVVADVTGSYIPAFVFLTGTTVLSFCGIVYACGRRKKLVRD